MITIEIPVRELHARTGHYVRKAASNVEVVVTERGVPAARLTALSPVNSTGQGLTIIARRKLLPEYRRLAENGALKSSRDGIREEDRGLRDL
jgi:prevent-host-death family protein